MSRQCARRPGFPDLRNGYLDLLGGRDDELPDAAGPAQRLMRSRALPLVYERWWRPAWGRVLKGALAGGMRDEHRIARLLLGLTPGDGVLDVACGPGNFTREFAQIVGPGGLAVGIDASATMLARAVADTPAGAKSPTSAATPRRSPSATRASTRSAASRRSTSSPTPTRPWTT